VAGKFHAVTINPEPNPCVAVNAIQGVRFLSNDAPHLPIPDCTNPDCGCAYEHYDDRRGRPRRDSDVGLPDSPPEDERRRRRGRRILD
jgi:hypothetical protein